MHAWGRFIVWEKDVGLATEYYAIGVSTSQLFFGAKTEKAGSFTWYKATATAV